MLIRVYSAHVATDGAAFLVARARSAPRFTVSDIYAELIVILREYANRNYPCATVNQYFI